MREILSVAGGDRNTNRNNMCDNIIIHQLGYYCINIWVLSCQYLHNDFIQNTLLFHSRDCRYYAEKARGARVLSCKDLHNDFIQNILLFHSRASSIIC